MEFKTHYRQRAALGWDEVHQALQELPSTKNENESSKSCFVGNATLGSGRGCVPMYQKRVFHYLGYPVFDVCDYDEVPDEVFWKYN